MRFNYLIILFFITLLSISCTENDNNSSSDNYDRASLLSNVVDNIIIPAHQNFDNELENFYQVCPKEMLDKLNNPITQKPFVKEVS